MRRHRKHQRPWCLLALLAVAGWPAAVAADLPLVAGGRSSYVIYPAPDAPDSVKLAADELQRIVRLATGVDLPKQHEPAPRMIALGNNPAAREAGLVGEPLPQDGFRIEVKGSNLYIVGNDDTSLWAAWSSRGTLYGTHEFLERVVGVRWLMPGDIGEDIPALQQLTVPRMSLRQAPDFLIRGLADVQDRRPPGDKRPSAPLQWLTRHKVNSTSASRMLNHWHSWTLYIPEETLQQHPEYLAVSGDPNKYCTSKAQVVADFAAGVIGWLDSRPDQRSTSISPTDGGGFCKCPQCRALVMDDPHGRPSHAPAILDFYNRIARIVREKHPDRWLAGYVYYNYMYPPATPLTMEPNVHLVWAPLNYYGWGLQKPAYRREFESVLRQWTALTPNLYYHNYSTWMRSFNGAPLPLGFGILKLEIPTLKKHGVKGVEMVGIGAWGYGGPANYVLAKQMWDAGVDVEALYREWLQRAYGPGWQSMDRIYQMLERRLKARKEQEDTAYRGMQYEVNYELIEDVHLPIFAEMGKLYSEALSRARTTAQRQRLAMFGDNLIMLHYNMRQAGMLSEPEGSVFYRSDEAYAKFLADTEFSLALYRDPGQRYTGPIWKGELRW